MPPIGLPKIFSRHFCSFAPGKQRPKPTGLCHDDTEESQARVRALMEQLSAYLETAGTWHDMKHTRDGRCYSWTPHTPKGEEAVQS